MLHVVVKMHVNVQHICNVQCPSEAACDSAAINNGNAIGFQCYGIDAHYPPIYSAPPVPVPTPAPTDKCSHLCM